MLFRFGEYDRAEHSCKMHEYNFDQTLAVAYYKGPARTLVLNLKNHDDFACAKLMAHLMWNQYHNVLQTYDLICAVPLVAKRLKKRCYNQSLLLAKYITKLTKVPLQLDLLEKVRDTMPQSQLSRQQRLINLKEAFIIKQRYTKLVQGKSILLIDDVITTGATANTISILLKSYGAKQVTVLVFAKA